MRLTLNRPIHENLNRPSQSRRSCTCTLTICRRTSYQDFSKHHHLLDCPEPPPSHSSRPGQFLQDGLAGLYQADVPARACDTAVLETSRVKALAWRIHDCNTRKTRRASARHEMVSSGTMLCGPQLPEYCTPFTVRKSKPLSVEKLTTSMASGCWGSRGGAWKLHSSSLG